VPHPLNLAIWSFNSPRIHATRNETKKQRKCDCKIEVGIKVIEQNRDRRKARRQEI
jgi:hypothetical protein